MFNRKRNSVPSSLRTREAGEAIHRARRLATDGSLRCARDDGFFRIFTRRSLIRLLTATAVLAGTNLLQPPLLAADPPMDVVASFSILGDMVRTVGGDRVRVTTLVGPDADAHVFEPTPADVRAIAASRVVFVNGLGFEAGWMPRLAEAAGFKGTVVVVSEGIRPLTMEEEEEEEHGHGGAHHAETPHDADDPHAWQNLANGKIYAQNIASALAAADPGGAAVYRRNADAYIEEMTALDAQVRAQIAAIPVARRKIVTSHDAFQYFGQAYGLQLLAPEGVSTEAEASAADVARLIRQIRSEKITAVFVENLSDNRLLDRIAKETGARIGGTVYSDSLSPEGGPAPTYLAMFRHNMAEFTRALAGS